MAIKYGNWIRKPLSNLTASINIDPLHDYILFFFEETFDTLYVQSKQKNSGHFHV